MDEWAGYINGNGILYRLTLWVPWGSWACIFSILGFCLEMTILGVGMCKRFAVWFRNMNIFSI